MGLNETDLPVLVRWEVDPPDNVDPYDDLGVDAAPSPYEEPPNEEYEDRYRDRPPQAGHLAAAADERCP